MSGETQISQQVLNGEFLQKLEGQELDLYGSSCSGTAGWTSIQKGLSYWCCIANIRGKNFSLLLNGGKKDQIEKKGKIPRAHNQMDEKEKEQHRS